MTRIQVAQVHQKILDAGIPIFGVASADGKTITRIDFAPEASEAQRKQAQIIALSHDQAAEDAAKEAAKQADASKRAQLLEKIAREVITEEDINLAFALSAQRRIMLGLLAQIELLRHELKIQTAARAETLPK
ncbi:MAG: hypothetical protein JNL34_05455 [Anaerolineae bacterium]|nr:hypothetical protein [Anaerolineae bacterium]